MLAFTPEGTRKAVPYWKTGFYHIAHGAGVPIALCYLDYSRKRGGLGPLLWPTGEIYKDMEKIRAHYAPMRGRYPELQGPVEVPAARAGRQGERIVSRARQPRVSSVATFPAWRRWTSRRPPRLTVR